MDTGTVNFAATHFKLRFFAGALAAGIFIGIGNFAAADEINVSLRGDNEVPTVTTSASGDAAITVGPDKSVTGSIKLTGIAGTVQIHMGAPGKNGAVVTTLVKTSEDVWSVPAGVVLTDAQYESYKIGNLYVDVHSAAHPEGEIRGQLKP